MIPRSWFYEVGCLLELCNRRKRRLRDQRRVLEKLDKIDVFQATLHGRFLVLREAKENGTLHGHSCLHRIIARACFRQNTANAERHPESTLTEPSRPLRDKWPQQRHYRP